MQKDSDIIEKKLNTLILTYTHAQIKINWLKNCAIFDVNSQC